MFTVKKFVENYESESNWTVESIIKRSDRIADLAIDTLAGNILFAVGILFAEALKLLGLAEKDLNKVNYINCKLYAEIKDGNIRKVKPIWTRIRLIADSKKFKNFFVLFIDILLKIVYNNYIIK